MKEQAFDTSANEIETTAIIKVIDSIRGAGMIIEWTDPKTGRPGRIWVKKNGRAIAKRFISSGGSKTYHVLRKINLRAAEDFNFRRAKIELRNDFSFKTAIQHDPDGETR